MNCYRCTTPIPDESRYCMSCGADVSGDGTQADPDVEGADEVEASLAEELAGEYVIERVLGRGGMAFVFLARDLQLGRRVAIKALPPSLTHGGLVERFKREARTAATLDHPHIVPIYRVSRSGKLFWFAMQYIDGESLAELLEREKRLSPERSAEILTAIADALEFAHEHGIVHRDVKPANVMIDRRGWVSVTDFGIAKAIGLEPLTATGLAVGTPFYMSPEQCSGKKAITPASDQYSLGVVAYQMLSGHLPFTGEAPVDLIRQHWLVPPPPLDVLRPGLPEGLAAVVERALAKTPEARFPSVTDFAKAFAAAVSRPPAPPPAPPPSPAAPELAVPPEHRERKRIVGIAGVGVALATIAVLLWQLVPSDGATEAQLAPDSAQQVASATSPGRDTTPSPVQSAAASGSVVRPASRVGFVFVLGLPKGGRVMVAGMQRGARFELSPGRHIAELRAPGYESQIATLQIRAGDTLRLRFNARPASPVRPAQATLRIQAQPPARIEIDGEDFGERGTFVRAVAGGAPHLISVVPVRSGYARTDTTITPAPGDTVTVRIRLKELQ